MKATGSLRRGPTFRNDKYNRPTTQFIEYTDEEKCAVNQHETYISDDNTSEKTVEKLNSRQSFTSARKRWSLLHTNNSSQSHSNGEQNSSEEDVQYFIVLHFRQLRGNQNFVLDHTSVQELCQRLNLTAQERIQFNGVHDTDRLLEFLYKTKREFSIKIHHKSTKPPTHPIIEFNANVYLEFKPKNHLHNPHAGKRRSFYQHPEPDLSADIGEEKAASWLELFYDLFYVATLTQFTHSHHIKDWESLALYTQWFIITWWAWCASSLYTARFDTDDVVHHIYKLVEMCAVTGMAGSSEYFLNSAGYVYGYMTLKTVLVVEYFVVLVVAILAKSKSRIALAFYVGANLLSMALWASSLSLLEKSTHRILWYMGVLCEILVNVIVRGDKRLSWAASNLAERIGLLSLIVLGENLIGLVTLVSVEGNSPIIVIPNFIAVFIIFGFFFMYFEDFNKEVFLHNKYHQIWVYIHFPLHLCQVAFGISLIDILKIYRYQLIRDHKLPENEIKELKGSNVTHNIQVNGTRNDTHNDSQHEAAGSDNSTQEAEAHHEKVKRDVFNIIHQDTYKPMEQQSNKLEFEAPQTSSAWYQTLISIFFATSTLSSTVESSRRLLPRSDFDSSDDDDEEKGSFTENITMGEIVFVYKTFLIFAGLILVINSMIKALNTKISDKYGKIVIGARVFNAAILWSMCALSFAKLDAIVLLCTLLASLIFQAFIDLFD